jgi:hypothetical protein
VIKIVQANTLFATSRQFANYDRTKVFIKIGACSTLNKLVLEWPELSVCPAHTSLKIGQKKIDLHQ